MAGKLEVNPGENILVDTIRSTLQGKKVKFPVRTVCGDRSEIHLLRPRKDGSLSPAVWFSDQDTGQGEAGEPSA